MKAKTEKCKSRVTVNTCILVILAVIIGVVTFLGAKRLTDYRVNLVGVSDAPGLCFDEGKFNDSGRSVIENAYPCVTDGEPVTSDNENVIFLFNRMNFTESINLTGQKITLIVIGSILSFATLVFAVVYWNHNR